jgi:histidine ammonia-lyase
LITAENIFTILADSKMISDEDIVSSVLQKNRENSPKKNPIPIEDAYSLRCTPQIIGPIRDNLGVINKVVEDELNSSNDNPLVIENEQNVFHNGNFHGQYIAMAMDHLAISLTTLSNLSDRRIDRFLDSHHSNGLPPFLSPKPGLQFGLMGGQFMATSLAAENRSLCIPLSVQTLTSTEDFQDIVSMGLIAARRARAILENTKYIIAFELMCACQAADIRGKEQLSSRTKILYEMVREIVPYYEKDNFMTDHLEALAKKIPFQFLENLNL